METCSCPSAASRHVLLLLPVMFSSCSCCSATRSKSSIYLSCGGKQNSRSRASYMSVFSDKGLSIPITNPGRSVYWLLLVTSLPLCQTSCPLRTVHFSTELSKSYPSTPLGKLKAIVDPGTVPGSPKQGKGGLWCVNLGLIRIRETVRFMRTTHAKKPDFNTGLVHESKTSSFSEFTQALFSKVLILLPRL